MLITTFEITLEGFDASTDETDHLVLWINAPSRSALDLLIEARNIKLDPNSPVNIVVGGEECVQVDAYGSTDGVDAVIDETGKVTETSHELFT